MFLAAVARPRFDANGNVVFNGNLEYGRSPTKKRQREKARTEQW
jgi:hypothetical protein